MLKYSLIQGGVTITRLHTEHLQSNFPYSKLLYVANMNYSFGHVRRKT